MPNRTRSLSSRHFIISLVGGCGLLSYLAIIGLLSASATAPLPPQNIASKNVTSPNAGFNNSFAYGDYVTYTIKITNTSSMTIEEQMSDTIPDGLRAITITNPGDFIIVDGDTVARYVGSVAPGETITMVLVTEVISDPQEIPDKIINRVRLDSTEVIYDAPEIAVLPPVTAAITGLNDVGVGQENVYTVVTNQDEYIESYRWEVGGAVVANTPMLNHTFDTAGEIEVTAIVTNGIGLTQTTSTTVTVFAAPEVTLDAPITVLMGEEVQYSATANIATGDSINDWEWRFGTEIINTMTNTVTYTFNPNTTDPFTTTVSVIATNSVGLTGTSSAEVLVQPQVNYLPAILRETCEDPHEPNNDPANATDLANGMSTFGAFTTCGDETNLDYFTFELDATSSTVIDLTNISTGANLDLILYRDPPPNPPLGFSAQVGGVDEHLEMADLPAGTYYILVLGTELLDPITTYQLSWDFQ